MAVLVGSNSGPSVVVLRRVNTAVDEVGLRLPFVMLSMSTFRLFSTFLGRCESSADSTLPDRRA
jgi:hypothetical protein